MVDQVISVGYGKENFQSSSVSLAAYCLGPSFVRSLPGRVYKREGSVQAYPATRFPDINGTLYVDTIRVPDGQLFLVQSSHKRHGAGIRDGAFFFRTRQTASLYLVQAALPAAAESMNGTRFPVLNGRGDILSPDEAVAEHGLELPRNFIRTWCDEEQIAECFVFHITQEGAERPPTSLVQTPDGGTVAVEDPTRRRRIRIR